MNSTNAEKTEADIQARRDPGSKPAFMLRSEIPNAERNQPTWDEIYITISKVISPYIIIGIQKVDCGLYISRTEEVDNAQFQPKIMNRSGFYFSSQVEYDDSLVSNLVLHIFI